MNDASLHVDLGTVRDQIGALTFKLIASRQGDACIRVYAHDPTDGRKSGVLLELDAQGYQKLKSILEYADCVARRMQATSRPESPKIHVASDDGELGEISAATVAFMLESEKLTLQDYYFDSAANEWRQLDQCPLLEGLF